jgi:GMP synthase (glutamine-hydrolysing)
VIESVAAHGGATAVIKSHHNVGGLPEDLDMDLVEPLRELFKDEVRALGRGLGLPGELVDRQPFPGPGLAVRILGEVTRGRCELLRAADAHLCARRSRACTAASTARSMLWQWFAVLLPVQSVGVMGDARTYENASCAAHRVERQDAMTADWAYAPGVRPAADLEPDHQRGPRPQPRGLDISSKPPATIEWE